MSELVKEGGLAIVALGSNLGDPKQNVRLGIEALRKLSQQPFLPSSLWRSTPLDCPPGSPDFVNAVAVLAPLENESPETLLDKLQNLERAFGRQPKKVLNEPRPLDLDLIAFGDQVRNTERLILPHPRACQRRFVLQPLAEVLPGLVLPGQTQSVACLLGGLPAERGLKRID